MVDNENQWEDMEYSDEVDASDDYSDEDYGDDDSEQDYESYDEDDGRVSGAAPKANPAGCIVVLILLALIIAGVVLFLMPKLKGGSDASSTQQTEQMTFETEQDANPDTAEMGELFFNEAGGDATEMMSVDFNQAPPVNAPASVETQETLPVQEQPQEQMQESQVEAGNEDLFAQEGESFDSQSQEGSEIMVSYSKSSRENPFKPPVIEVQNNENSELLNNTPFEIIEPPVASVPDENLTRLLQTQISGILYDEESPSAIVNLNGMDQFVKPGDTVAGYTIDYITRDKVQISYQNNSYVASVGELFTRGVLEREPAVVNLENKFAGRYKNNQ